MSEHSPFLLVVSAPSGCGKTTILKRVLAEDPGLAFSVSVTSRPPREGESDGCDYHFITAEQFREQIEHDEFIEYAEVHGNYYGTSRSLVLRLLADGFDVVLDIDVQGMMQLERTWPYDLVTVFILPPSYRELRSRLVSRGTDSDDVIQRRLTNALGEIEQAGRYRYLLQNKDVDEAVSGLKSILVSERSKANRNDKLIAGLIRDFRMSLQSFSDRIE